MGSAGLVFRDRPTLGKRPREVRSSCTNFEESRGCGRLTQSVSRRDRRRFCAGKIVNLALVTIRGRRGAPKLHYHSKQRRTVSLSLSPSRPPSLVMQCSVASRWGKGKRYKEIPAELTSVRPRPWRHVMTVIWSSAACAFVRTHSEDGEEECAIL